MAQTRTYLRNSVMTASPAELVVQLYDGARRFLRQGADAMAERQVERAHNTLQRAELIIQHLDDVIDDQQGEISERLHAIYRFCMLHLGEARMTQDPEKVREVSGMLTELRDAFKEISQR